MMNSLRSLQKNQQVKKLLGVLLANSIVGGILLYYCKHSGCMGIAFHLIITLAVKNEPFDHIIKASSPNLIQEQISDISESLCRYVPRLTNFFLPKMNPFLVLGMFDFSAILICRIFIEIGSISAMFYTSLVICFITIITMIPFTVSSATILLQTTPSHLTAQLDKSLREASTLDGVLEFRNEHFWTLSFGYLVGSLHVRIRRDADEQIVMAHVWNKLSSFVQILTIHIFKDDWARKTNQLVYNQQNLTFKSNLLELPSLNPQTEKTQSKSPSIDNDYIVIN